MFKKLIQIPAVFCFVFIASRSNAQPASQLFTVVNGPYANASASNGNPSVTLPVLGFALDQSGGLRPLIGITGSASVGAPIDLPLPIVKATMPGNHDYILAMTGGSTWPVLLQVRGNTINVSSMTPPAGNVAKARTVRCHQRNSFDDRALSSCDTDSTAVGVASAIDSIAGARPVRRPHYSARLLGGFMRSPTSSRCLSCPGPSRLEQSAASALSESVTTGQPSLWEDRIPIQARSM